MLKFWIKRYLIRSALVLFLALLMFPFLVDFAYLKGASTAKPYFTNYTASDLLSAWGSFLAFIGTVALGTLAIWQNHVIEKNSSEFNRKLLKLTEDQKHQSVRPYLSIDQIDLDEQKELDFSIYNEGVGLAINIKIELQWSKDSSTIYKDGYNRLDVVNKYSTLLNEITNQLCKMNNNGYTISSLDNSIYIEAPLKTKIVQDPELTIRLTYEDIYGKEYTSLFDLVYNIKDDEVISMRERFF